MPKPLFATGTKADTAIRPQELVEQAVNQTTIRFQAAQPANIVPAAKPKTALSSRVNIRDRNQVANYGAKAQEKVTGMADEVLEYVKTANAGAVGERLVQIVSIAKELNISDLNGNTSKIPLIGGLIDRFNRKRDAFVAKYNTLSEQIAKVVGELDTTAKNLNTRNIQLDALYAANMEEYKELETLIAEAKDILAENEAVFEAEKQHAIASGDMSNPMVAQNLTDWSDDIERWRKHISFLEATQMMCVHAMPEIRLIQKSNVLLCEKFDNAKKYTIPAWKKQFMLAVALDEQKKAGEFATTIDDATNEFYRKNADLMKTNALVVAKANERNVIDIESLQYMQTSLITTFEELKGIEAEGAQKRRELSGAVMAMKKELYEKLVVQR